MICNEIDGQYIIPILRERIDKIGQEYIDKAKILELSTDNKFFKILRDQKEFIVLLGD